MPPSLDHVVEEKLSWLERQIRNSKVASLMPIVGILLCSWKKTQSMMGKKILNK